MEIFVLRPEGVVTYAEWEQTEIGNGILPFTVTPKFGTKIFVLRPEGVVTYGEWEQTEIGNGILPFTVTPKGTSRN